MKKDSKQRLFEVMQRVDPSFKRKLNEEVSPEIQKKVAMLISDIETNYETRNSQTITDALFFDYGLKGQVEYNDLLNHVRQKQIAAKNAAMQSGDYIQAGRNVNGPEDTGTGERPLTNQHGEYMGMYETNLNEGEENAIDIVLDFPKNTSSINTNGQVLASNFPLTEDGLYNALYPLYTSPGKRYYNLMEVAYVNPRGRSGNYEMDIMLSDAQNQNYVVRDMKDNIEELFIEINKDDGDNKPGVPAPGAEKQGFGEGKKKNNKPRLFEVMGHLDKTFKPKLNEGDAFNDAGEPRMTASQFRAYSEPSEPEYDDSRDDGPPAYEAADSVIVPKIEKHFNTALNVYRGNNLINYGFVLKTNNPIGKCTMQIVFDGDMVDASRPDCKEFNGQGHYEDIDIEELFNFFEPYREYIVTPHENAIKKIQNALNHARDY